MTKVIFRFDTEDYVNKNAADGVLRVINVLNNAGVKGVFSIVGEFAKALREWGREDIVEALKQHRIGTHSLRHSHHPTINEYTDIEDFDEALRLFMEDEQKCLDILKEVFGLGKIDSCCAPGASVSYVAQYGYSELGVAAHVGGGGYFGDRNHGRVTKYANILTVKTSHYLDEIHTFTKPYIDGLLDGIAENDDFCVFCHHPAMNVVDTFFDALNYNGENVPREGWIKSPERSEADKALWIENFEYLVKKVCEDERFCVVTDEYIINNYFTDPRVINRETLRQIKPLIDEAFFPVTQPDSYCLSDIFYACRDLLLGKEEYVCGKAYGLLSAPYAISGSVTVKAADMRESAKGLGDGFIPEKIRVGHIDMGPADWMRAALCLLTEGGGTVTVREGAWQVDLSNFPEINGSTFKGSWVHAASFEDRFISDRIRLQLWTAMLPKNTERFIY